MRFAGRSGLYLFVGALLAGALAGSAEPLKTSPAENPDFTLIGAGDDFVHAQYACPDRLRLNPYSTAVSTVFILIPPGAEYTVRDLAPDVRNRFEVTSVDDRGDESEDTADISVGTYWKPFFEAP